jgi:DnaJ-class molecular chaperone
MNDFLEQWQSCPQCNGDCGAFELSEEKTESSYISWQTCDLCNGEGVIRLPYGRGTDDV